MEVHRPLYAGEENLIRVEFKVGWDLELVEKTGRKEKSMLLPGFEPLCHPARSHYTD
jgi:hypothetical protein